MLLIGKLLFLLKVEAFIGESSIKMSNVTYGKKTFMIFYNWKMMNFASVDFKCI